MKKLRSRFDNAMLRASLLVALLPLVGYTVFLLLLTIPWVQNHVNTMWWYDLDDPESFGFGKNQVTPFNITTPDGETLHAWHILPRALYAKHQTEILKQKLGKTNDFKETVAYKLLTEDPNSKLIVNFHGNAGHLLENYRSNVYRSYSSLHPSTHLIAFSYRGFGRSTGSPNEPGLITDGISVVNYALNDLALPPSRVALVGQSLGTAVLSGVIERFLAGKEVDEDFALILLICGFRDLKSLLLEYHIAGMIPILAPLAKFPGIQRVLQDVVVDTWESQKRLKSVAETAFRSEGNRKLNIQFIHAADDWDIPFNNSVSNYEALLQIGKELGSDEVVKENAGSLEDGDARRSAIWEDGKVKLGLRVVRLGGHNRLPTDTPVAVALLHNLDLIDAKPS